MSLADPKLPHQVTMCLCFSRYAPSAFGNPGSPERPHPAIAGNGSRTCELAARQVRSRAVRTEPKVLLLHAGDFLSTKSK